MGTNFYGRIIPTHERKKKLCELIENSDDFTEIKNEINNTYSSVEYNPYEKKITGGIVHLGKRSSGWKFLWNPNWYIVHNGHLSPREVEKGHIVYNYITEPNTVEKLYELNKKSIKEFIDREDVEIYDEYGEKQDKDEFFDMALNWTTWGGKEAYDSDAYEEEERKENPNRYFYVCKNELVTFLEENGYKLSKTKSDFYSDGLRFSTSTEFS